MARPQQQFQLQQQLQQWCLRMQGRKLALYLLGICCFFSLLTAYHFDLESSSGSSDESLFFAPIHARTVMNLDQIHEKDTFLKNDYQWEQIYDEEPDYHSCPLNAASSPGATQVKNGCWTDNANTKMAICRVNDLQVWPEHKISGPPGGEDLTNVMGREEDLEFPQYQLGAFSTKHALEFQTSGTENNGGHSLANRDYWFYLVDVFFAMDMNQNQNKCTSTEKGISLVLTRYEYVDLYHTVKDWWNAFFLLASEVSLPDADLNGPDDVLPQASRIVFLDSHAAGQLDPVWETLFGGQIQRIKQIPDGTCLEHAWFVPSGYSSVLWSLGRVFDETSHRCPSMADAFVHHVLQTHDVHHLKRSEDTINIVIVHQPKHHILHPRSSVSMEPPEREQFWVDLQAKLLDDTDASSVQIVDLHKMHFKAQLKLVRRAHILIGYTGCDHLTLGMFLPDNSTVMEVSVDSASSEDLSTMLKWRPSITYKSVQNTLRWILPEIKDVLTPGWDEKEPRYADDEGGNFGNNYYPFNMTSNDDEFTGGELDWENPNSGNTNNIDLANPEKSLRGRGYNDYESGLEQQDLATNFQQCKIYQDAYQVAKENHDHHLHGCHVDSSSGSNIPICCLHNIQLHASEIDFHGITGGEFLDTVLGRDEALEFPQWKERAVTVSEELKMPPSLSSDKENAQLHYVKDILNTVKVVPDKDCTITWSEPILMIQRYEYVDLYRTLNDWWNTYWSLPSTASDQQQQPLIMFLDSHAEGYLDPVWQKVFGPTQHLAQAVKNEDKDAVICIPEATLVPSGYASSLSRSSGDDNNNNSGWKPCPAMTKAFVQHFLKAYELEEEELDPLRVTIFESPTDFITHPRQTATNNNGVSSFQMSALSKQLSTEYPELKIKTIQREKMSFRESLKLLRQTHVLLLDEGTTSASMTLFLSEGAHVLDLNSGEASNNLEETIMPWLSRNITYRYEVFNQMDYQEDQVRSVLFPILEYVIWNRITTTTTAAVTNGEGDDKAKDTMDKTTTTTDKIVVEEEKIEKEEDAPLDEIPVTDDETNEAVKEEETIMDKEDED